MRDSKTLSGKSWTGEAAGGASLEGWGSGLLGVIIFSGSLPATRVAVAGFSPLFLTAARAAIAALLGAVPSAVLGGVATVAVALLWMKLFPTLRDVEKLE